MPALRVREQRRGVRRPVSRLPSTTGRLAAPKMYYGAHKLMMEAWLATMTRRGAVHGLSLRLPGIVARPRAPSGMRSAFLSDLFHALRAAIADEMPVSAGATSWLLSRCRASLLICVTPVEIDRRWGA